MTSQYARKFMIDLVRVSIPSLPYFHVAETVPQVSCLLAEFEIEDGVATAETFFLEIPGGVITATRPDGGFWAQHVRDHGGDGWLRIGDATYAMEAIEIHGEEADEMMRLWAGGRSIDEPLGQGAPLRDWEVFFWRPR